MKVSIIGSGYVGLVSGTCFAQLGHEVTCIDIDENKISTLKKAQSPIYEPGLTDLLKLNIEAGRLSFSTSYESIKESKITFLAVGTPSAEDGHANLEYLFESVKSLAPMIEDDAIVVIKSTVPIGTYQKVKELLSGLTSKKFFIVNNPEFLKEGSAIDDFMKPDRVVIGHEGDYSAQMMKELYEPLMLQGNPIYFMSNVSAEMTKYAANSMLATKISFINEIARLCDVTGADIEEVRKGITSDRRIGIHFLYPGPGYGGSCFPKDVKEIIATGKDVECELEILNSVESVNQKQKIYMAQKVQSHFGGNLKGKKVAFWGVSFKPNTDDIREAPAIDMAKFLTEQGAEIVFYDPVATKNFQRYMDHLGVKVTSSNDKYELLKDVDCLMLVTEWHEFRSPDFSKVKEFMRGLSVFDCRNLYPSSKIKAAGLEYFGVGKR